MLISLLHLHLVPIIQLTLTGKADGSLLRTEPSVGVTVGPCTVRILL